MVLTTGSWAARSPKSKGFRPIVCRNKMRTLSGTSSWQRGCLLCSPFLGEEWSERGLYCMHVDGAAMGKVLGRAQAGTAWLKGRNETKQNSKVWNLGSREVDWP